MSESTRVRDLATTDWRYQLTNDMGFEPTDNDFERFRTVVTGGIPDRVPIGDGYISSPKLKQAILGRPVVSVADEVTFWAATGSDFVPYARCFDEDDSIQRHVKVASVSDYGLDQAQDSINWAMSSRVVISSEADFERFEWPSVDDLDISFMDEAALTLPARMRLVPMTGTIFGTVWELMGFNNFCLAIVDRSPLIDLMYSRVGEIVYGLFGRLVSHPAVGAFWIDDDLAYSGGLLVSADHYRRYLFPWYAKMCDECHRRGLPIIYHSDGRITQVLDDLIDLGVMVIHPLEQKSMDIREVKRRYGSRLCLMGGVDINYTLPLGTPEEVDSEVRELIRDLAPGGGYVVAAANSLPNWIPEENYKAMLRAVRKYGSYPISV